MNASAAQARVLKIGVVVDEQLMMERTIDLSAPVTIGPSAGATFQQANTGLGDQDYAVFVWREGRYYVRFQPPMKGRLTASGNKHALEKSVRDASVERDGDAWLLPLVEDDKGKIEVGPVTLLFRFVEAPAPAPMAVQEDIVFRSRWLEDDDPDFMGFLGFHLLLAALLGIWVQTLPPRELTLEDLNGQLARVVVRPRIQAEQKMAEIKSDKAPAEEVKAADEPKPEPKAKSQDRVEAAKQMDAAKRDMAGSALFQFQAKIIGTQGQGNSGLIARDASGDLSGLSDEIMRTGSGTTVADGSRVRGGGVVNGSDKGIGSLEAGAVGGGGTLDKVPVVKVKPSLSTGDMDYDGGDSTNVKGVVKANRGNLTYCYETRLKLNPKLAGKLVLRWTVAAGVAQDVHIVDNTTDDDEFGSCVVSKIRRWKFTEVADGTVTQSFVFQPVTE